MATVGDQLTTPETGWKRYDDAHSCIKYTGNFGVLSQSGFVNGSYHYVNEGEIHFLFKGTMLRIIGVNNNNKSSNILITIDGIEESFSQYNSSTTIITCLNYEKKELDNIIHEVKISEYGDNDMILDAIDIDSDGRLFHPDEVTSIADLEVGKRIRCHYSTFTRDQYGVFSNLGEETYKDGINDFLPSTPTATPDGDFYFIMVEDWNGKKRLIADRNLQNNISWNTLNNNGLVFGRNAEIDLIPLVPVMNNTTTNGITITANSYVDTSYAWKAFDRGYSINNPRNIWYTTAAPPNGGHWLKVDFGEGNEKIVSKIALSSFLITGTSFSIKDWELYGSNDDIEYVKLLGDTFPNKSALLDFNIPLDKRVPYRYYRINVLNSYTTNSVGILEAQLYSIENNFKEYDITTRLMTGGVTGTNGGSSTDKNNEWDKYIINSDLNGTITAGDDDVWHWSVNQSSWTSTTNSTVDNVHRVVRGRSTLSTPEYYYTNDSNTLSSSANGFCSYRPLLEIEKLLQYKTFILHNGKYKKYDTFWSDYSDTLPTIDQFISDGMNDLSVFDRNPKTETIVMNDDINGGTGEVLGNGKVFKETIDLNKYFDLISLNIK